MLRMGIFFTTYYVLTYFSMTEGNKMSMLFAAAVIDAIGFTAITLSLLNLMMEVSGEPADAYVGAYALVSGIAAILAGLFGGLIGKFINNGVIYIFGEEFYTIRFAFVIGFILRLFSLLELTRVDSFEKTFVYSGTNHMKSVFSKIMFSGSRYINPDKSKNSYFSGNSSEEEAKEKTDRKTDEKTENNNQNNNENNENNV